MKPQGWRRIATATWRGPNDPQIYGDLELDATAVLAFLDEVRASAGVHVTVTHAVGRALAHALAEHPDLNVRLSRGRFVPRESVDIFFVASVAGGAEVSGVKIVGADRKSMIEIAEGAFGPRRADPERRRRRRRPRPRAREGVP